MTACTSERKRVHWACMVPAPAREWACVPDKRHQGRFAEAFACLPKRNRDLRGRSPNTFSALDLNVAAGFCF